MENVSSVAITGCHAMSPCQVSFFGPFFLLKWRFLKLFKRSVYGNIMTVFAFANSIICQILRKNHQLLSDFHWILKKKHLLKVKKKKVCCYGLLYVICTPYHSNKFWQVLCTWQPFLKSIMYMATNYKVYYLCKHEKKNWKYYFYE